MAGGAGRGDRQAGAKILADALAAYRAAPAQLSGLAKLRAARRSRTAAKSPAESH
jgi:hypothetical protein